MARPVPHARGDYRHTREITTRWMDNDAYGHVNNVVHYSLFDTVVNDWLIRRLGNRRWARSIIGGGRR